MRINILPYIIALIICFQFMTNAQPNIERPKLVVGIVVDQMRNEFLYRFYEDFGDDGFKRLMREGYYFANTHYDFVPTYTAPGHASIYTGAYPGDHGIVSNSWFDREQERVVYCTEDKDHQIVGSIGRGMSCYSLRATTFTDELEMFTNKASKVVGISLKDRGAILPAGHFADAAYWFTDDGSFVSSTYYMDTLPEWVEEFNAERKPIAYFKMGWDKLPDVDFTKSLPDSNAYESRLGGKDAPVFPYDLTTLIKYGGVGSIRTTPYGNDLALDFAEAAITSEDLGGDDVTDVLAISFSSTDYMGHAMGPRSMEIQDLYVRLDKSIARFLEYLDENVGVDNYLLFLTSDHGAAEVPAYTADNKMYAEALGFSAVSKELKDFSMSAWGENIIQHAADFNVYLNNDVLESKNIDKEEACEKIRTFLLGQDYIKIAYTAEEIMEASCSDPTLKLVRRGFDPQQSGDVIYIFKSGYLEYKTVGTHHGSPYTYDTHVPLLFFGKGINAGVNYDKKYITQIAPTISHLIKIGLPSATQSEALLEVLQTRE